MPALMNAIRRLMLRAMIGSFFALSLSGAALSQTFPCPVTSQTTVSGVEFPNSSACTVQSGATLSVGSNGTLVNDTNLITIEQNGRMTNGGLIYNWNEPTASASGPGPQGGTISNFGTLFNDNVLNNGPGTLNNSGILTNYGTITDNVGDASTSPVLYGGVVNNEGTLTNGGTLNLGFSVLNNGAGASLFNLGSANIGKGFSNDGTLINFSGAAITISGGPSVNDAGGTLTNEMGGSMIVTGSFTNAGTFNNNGNLTVNSMVNTGVTNNTGSLSANGTLFVEAGSVLNNVAGSTFVQTASGFTVVYGTINSAPTMQIQGGSLLGTGTINGNVNNTGGVVTPGQLSIAPAPGMLTINGNYTQGPNGTLAIELGEDKPGDFSVLDVGGLATIDGTVDFIGPVGFGFTPEPGDDFTFLEYDSLAGNFNVEFTDWRCPTGDSCSIVKGISSLSLDITGPSGGSGPSGGMPPVGAPEPSTLLLLGAAMLALVACSRARRVSANA